MTCPSSVVSFCSYNVKRSTRPSGTLSLVHTNPLVEVFGNLRLLFSDTRTRPSSVVSLRSGGMQSFFTGLPPVFPSHSLLSSFAPFPIVARPLYTVLPVGFTCTGSEVFWSDMSQTWGQEISYLEVSGSQSRVDLVCVPRTYVPDTLPP